MDRKELIQAIEGRIQLALTISIFLPVLSAAFAGRGGVKNPESSESTIGLMILVGLYLLVYLFFQGLKKVEARDWLLKSLNISLLVGIASFVIFVFCLTTVDPNATLSSLTWIGVVALKSSIWGPPLTALISLVLISIGIAEGLSRGD